MFQCVKLLNSLLCVWLINSLLCVRLEHGANATIQDVKGRTPLTIAFEEEKKKIQRGIDSRYSLVETLLDLILKLANPLHVLEGDLMLSASDLGYGKGKNILTSILWGGRLYKGQKA